MESKALLVTVALLSCVVQLGRADSGLTEERFVTSLKALLDTPAPTDPEHPYHDLIEIVLKGGFSRSNILAAIQNVTRRVSMPQVSPQCHLDMSRILASTLERQMWGLSCKC